MGPFKLLGLPSPAAMLAAVLGCIAVFGFGYSLGGKHARQSWAEDQLEVANAVVERFRGEVEAAQQLAIKEAQSEAVAQQAAKAARSRGVKSASRLNNPVCSLSAADVGLLNDAVRAANDKAVTAKSVPDLVPRDTGAAR